MIQVAVSAILIMGAVLFLRTLWNASRVNPGFSPDHVVSASIDLSTAGYTRETGPLFCSRLLEQLRALPGVRSAALALVVPVQQSQLPLAFYLDPGGATPWVWSASNHITPGYFKTLGLSLLKGREFTTADDAAAVRVAILSSEAAARYFPKQNPIGKRIYPPPLRKPVEIVGVVSGAHYESMRTVLGPMVYLPFEQQYRSRVTIVIRTEAAVDPYAHRFKECLGWTEPEHPVAGCPTLQQRISASLAEEHLAALLFSGFGFLSFLLASAGLYAVISYRAQLRAREMGIRIALGASAGNVKRTVIAQGMALTLMGLFAGLAVAGVLSRFVAALLFGVQPSDPLTYGITVAVFAGTCLLATWLPARKATLVSTPRKFCAGNSSEIHRRKRHGSTLRNHLATIATRATEDSDPPPGRKVRHCRFHREGAGELTTETQRSRLLLAALFAPRFSYSLVIYCRFLHHKINEKLLWRCSMGFSIGRPSQNFPVPEQNQNLESAAENNAVKETSAPLSESSKEMAETASRPQPQNELRNPAAEAFLQGNLLATQLREPLNNAVSKGAAEAQQSVPILPNEAQSLSNMMPGGEVQQSEAILPGGEVQQSEAITPGEVQAPAGGIFTPISNDLFEVNAEGNLTINNDRLAEMLNTKKEE